VLLPVIPLLAVVGLFVALGLAVTARPLSQGFVSWLQNAGKVAQFFGGISATIAVKLTRWITHNIGAEWSDLERLGVTWLSGLFQWADLAVTNALEWPLWLWRVQRWLLFTELPHLLKQVPHAIAGTVTHIVTQVRTVERTVVKLPKLSKAAAKALVSAAVATYVHPFLADLQWLRRHFHALTAVLPRALPIPQVPSIPNVWKRIRALEKKLAVPLGIAAVVAAIGRLGIGWIRCNKVRRLGKAACGFDDSLIDKLLLDALAIFGVLSVVEFAEGLLAIEDEAVSIMGSLVREWPT
jgi:hypothetical protein